MAAWKDKRSCESVAQSGELYGVKGYAIECPWSLVRVQPLSQKVHFEMIEMAGLLTIAYFGNDSMVRRRIIIKAQSSVWRE